MSRRGHSDNVGISTRHVCTLHASGTDNAATGRQSRTAHSSRGTGTACQGGAVHRGT